MNQSCLSEFPVKMQGAVVDVLTQAVEQGPVWSGDLVSKAGKDYLIQSGHLVPVLVKGEDGYYAANHKGRDLYKALYGTSLGGDADTVSEARANRLAGSIMHKAKGG